jgi:hypothetical protein
MCLLEALLAPQQQVLGDSLHQSQDLEMAGAAAHASPGPHAGGSGQGNNVGHEAAGAAAAGVEGLGGDAGAGEGGAAQLKQTILDTLRRL